MSNEDNSINALVNQRVEEAREKERMDEKLNAIVKSSSIYPDIIKSLSSLRKSVEVLNNTVVEIENKQTGQIADSGKHEKDLKNLFDKIREVNCNITKLELELIDKNNSGSLVEIIIELVEDQNKHMTDKNNPKSIISILLKSSRLQNWITWILLTGITVIELVTRLT